MPTTLEFLDLTLADAAANLALDEALLLEAEAEEGGEVLRLWEWTHPAVVLGAGCVLNEDVNEAACQAADVPILRRGSGGGTVLLGAGCLCFSLVLAYGRNPALQDVNASYRYLLQQLVEGLRDILPGITLAGTSDLTQEGWKFSGNAQQRKRSHLLHHGTLLYAFDLDQVERFLNVPRRQPDYRQQRGHRQFLRNLPITREALAQRLQSLWQAEPSGRLNLPLSRVETLLTERFRDPAWIRRR